MNAILELTKKTRTSGHSPSGLGLLADRGGVAALLERTGTGLVSPRDPFANPTMEDDDDGDDDFMWDDEDEDDFDSEEGGSEDEEFDYEDDDDDDAFGDDDDDDDDDDDEV